MRCWDNLSLTQLLVGRIGHPIKDRLAEWPMLAFILSLKIVSNLSAYRPDKFDISCHFMFQEQLGV